MFQKKGAGMEEARKFFERLSPDQQQKFLENFERWQDLTQEERTALREHEEFRRQKILGEINKSIEQSGLHLNQDERDMYILRYTQERRKIEIKLQREMDEKRKPLLEDVNKRLRQEFQSMSATSTAASPASTAPVTSSPSPTP